MEKFPAPPDLHRKAYSEMTIDERWEWHTDVYAFRRVFLDSLDEISPPDPDGKWFNREAVDRAERRKRIKMRR